MNWILHTATDIGFYLNVVASDSFKYWLYFRNKCLKTHNISFYWSTPSSHAKLFCCTCVLACVNIIHIHMWTRGAHFDEKNSPSSKSQTLIKLTMAAVKSPWIANKQTTSIQIKAQNTPPNIQPAMTSQLMLYADLQLSMLLLRDKKLSNENGSNPLDYRGAWGLMAS